MTDWKERLGARDQDSPIEAIGNDDNEYTVDITISVEFNWATPPKNNTEKIYRAQKKTLLLRALYAISQRLNKAMNTSDTDREISSIVNSMFEL